MAVYPYGNTCLVQELIHTINRIILLTLDLFQRFVAQIGDRWPGNILSDADTSVLKIEPGSKRLQRSLRASLLDRLHSPYPYMVIKIELFGVGKKTYGFHPSLSSLHSLDFRIQPAHSGLNPQEEKRFPGTSLSHIL